MKRIVALAGGVGGAKLAHGLAMAVPPDDLTVIVNVGDDFDHLGFPICPDLDTVLYTLAGIANRETGWGIAGETWSFMKALERLGGETWFRLGDKDLATHTFRREMLAGGAALSDAIDKLRRRLGVGCVVSPASDDRVRTRVQTAEGLLDFQTYFVREQCRPVVQGLTYEGAAVARPAAKDGVPWTDLPVEGVVLCPSNPYLSLAPILAIPRVRLWLEGRRCPALAVSPIIGGQAVKGPAAKLMREFGRDPSAVTVANYYRGLIDFLLIHPSDAELAPAIASLGIEPVVGNILMQNDDDRLMLAQLCLKTLEAASNR